MPSMSTVFEIGSKGASMVGGALDSAQSNGAFLTVGGKQSVAGVDSSAQQALGVAQKAPDMAVSLTTAGANLAVDATKTALTFTGAGAAIAAGIQVVQTMVEKGLEKMSDAKAQGSTANREAEAPGRGE